jgi:putative methyltransferase (TIGR04325 family)
MSDAYRVLRQVEKVVKELPPVRAFQERAYERQFASDEAYGWFRGIFPTFAEAVQSAPSSKTTGFDLPKYARMFDERHDRVFAYDYPVLFWLSSLLRPGVRLFDFGGHVGVQFYGYQKYLQFPEGLRWQVCDVPSVVKRGQELAAERQVTDRLSFTTDATKADGADILIAAGSLQFVESPPLSETLRRLEHRPKHLLLNKLPLGASPAFVTLQNAGTSFVAQHVYNRAEFVEGFTRTGYEVVDEWEDRIHSCWIPFHHDRSVPHYSGLYLRMK